jgi:5'-nucleotidase
VHIALTGLLGYRPDLVVSGINNGANMGDDTIYSGTVGAAMEGYLFGIPAIAFSQTKRAGPMSTRRRKCARTGAADRARTDARRRALAAQREHPEPADSTRTEAVKVCRLGRRHAAEKVITQTSPRGETMYWIGGAGGAKDERRGHRLPRHAAGHIAITPLQVDLTDHDALRYWARWPRDWWRRRRQLTWPRKGPVFPFA